MQTFIYFPPEKRQTREILPSLSHLAKDSPQQPGMLGSRSEVQEDCQLRHEKLRELMEGWEVVRACMGTGEKLEAKFQFSQS